MITANFHIHTKYSHDSNLEPSEILKTAEKLKFDVLGICDHNTTEGAIETRKLAKNILSGTTGDRCKATNVLVLIGQEIKTEYGDLVVFGTEENLERDLFGLLDKAVSKDLFIVFPHPFDKFRRSAMGNKLSKKKLLDVLKKIDAIEVFNSRCLLDRANKKAQEVAAEFKIPGIAASDAHFASELGNARNFLDCEKNEEEIYKAIKKGKITWTGKRAKSTDLIKKYFL